MRALYFINLSLHFEGLKNASQDHQWRAFAMRLRFRTRQVGGSEGKDESQLEVWVKQV